MPFDISDCSIVIATYNRSDLLKETLDSLLSHFRSYDHASQPEIIIVDNNSTDETSRVAASYKEKFNTLKTVHETQQGLSHGRNRGISSATRQIIAFLDDDVEVADRWLEELLRPFSNPLTAVVGGRVLPFGYASLPDWLPRRYAFLASVFDPSAEPCQLDSVMGANFAVRRDMFEKVGVFDPSLGRKGTKLLGGEENELFRRIRGAGGAVLYTPHSVVWHKISSKLNREYIYDYAYWLGVSDAYLDKQSKQSRRYLLKYLRSIFFPTLIYPLRYKILSHLLRNPANEAMYNIKQKYAFGYLSSKRELSDLA